MRAGLVQFGKVAILAVLLPAVPAVAEDAEDFDRWYAGAGASLVLPQNGSPLRRLGGGAAHAGCYLTDALAVECGAAWLEDKAALSARGLWHWHGCEAFDLLFGYERLDPFFTAGVCGVMTDGTVGPEVGLGALYYLTDHWALRGEADATLGLEHGTAMVYALAVGVQYSF